MRSPRNRTLVRAIGVTVVVGALSPVVGAAPASAAAVTSATYSSPGTYAYTVPDATTVVSVTVGGGVGETPTRGGTGGPGAIVSGVMTVAPGSTVTIIVGSAGGGATWDGGPGNSSGGAGGGAALVIAGANGLAAGGEIVAGGGGGGGATAGYAAGSGGAGGAVGAPGTAGDVWTSGQGGGGATTTSGGSGGAVPAGCLANGTAGSAGSATTGGAGGYGYRGNNGGGGGGGGLFGGGGGSGGSGCNASGGGGGGGGSSTFSTSVLDPTLCTGCNTGPAFVTITDGADPELFHQVDAPGYPSSACQADGGTTVVDTTNNGLRMFVYTFQPSSGVVDVCFRLDGGAGAMYGGMVTITPAVPQTSVTGLSAPSFPQPTFGPPTEDGNASYCATPPDGSPADQLPVQHPLSSGTLPGGAATWSFDLYSDEATTTWVCATIGPLSGRVVVPVTVPTVPLPSIDHPSAGIEPGYDVTFYPDTGNL